MVAQYQSHKYADGIESKIFTMLNINLQNETSS